MKVRQLPGSKGNFWLGVTTPDSVRVTTGIGIQIYFQPGGLKTTANPDGTGIDVRAAGGYVIAPGRRHPNGFYPVRARRLARSLISRRLDEPQPPCPVYTQWRCPWRDRQAIRGVAFEAVPVGRLLTANTICGPRYGTETLRVDRGVVCWCATIRARRPTGWSTRSIPASSLNCALPPPFRATVKL